MYLKVLCVVLLGFVVGGTRAIDKFHLKIQVPEFVNHHHHTKFLLLDDAKKPEFKKSPPIEHHFPKSSHYSFEPYGNNGFHKSWKTLRSEKYETETVDNPFSDNPGNKYLVKGTYKVKEKLPYIDIPIGYEREYSYPTSDISNDHHKSEKVVDFNNAQTDPFLTSNYEIPKQKEEQKNPKNYNYYYKYPATDYEFSKNVRLVDSYIKTTPEPLDDFKKDTYKTENENFNDVGYNSNKSPEYEVFESELDSPPPKKFETLEDFALSEISSPDSEKYQSPDFGSIAPSEFDPYNSPAKNQKPKKQKATTSPYATYDPEIESYSNNFDKTEKYPNHNYDFGSPEIANYGSSAKSGQTSHFDSFDPSAELDSINNADHSDKYESPNFDRLGPTDLESYAHYKTDGPTFQYS